MAPFILAADVAPISRFFLTPSSGQTLMVRKPSWPRGEKMGSLEAGAKLINIENGQALRVLLDMGAWHRGTVGYQGRSGWWHRRHFWKRGSPARLHAPSPSAPEAWFWAPWQEASKWKGKTKKCFFFFFCHLHIHTAQGYEWEVLILWPFKPTAGGRQEKKNKTSKTNIKDTILFLFCPCLLFI